MNSISVTGFISTDIIIDVTPTGKYVAKFGMSISNPRKKKLSFVDVEVWNGPAKTLEDFVEKGSKVGITGYLEVSTWKDHNNTTRKRPYIVTDMVEFLSFKEQNKPKKEKVNMSDLSATDISDDDLPF